MLKKLIRNALVGLAALAASVVCMAPSFAQSGPPQPLPPSVVCNTCQVSLAATNSSANVALPLMSPAYNTVTVYNSGTVDAYVAQGGSSIAATTSNILVKAGTYATMWASGTYVAGITASGSTTLVIYQSNGPISFGRNELPGGIGGSPGQIQYNNGSGNLAGLGWTCVPTAATDAAIRACITQIEATNGPGTVFLQNATYSITSTLPAAYSNGSSFEMAISYIGIKPVPVYTGSSSTGYTTESNWTFASGGGTIIDCGSGSFAAVSANTSSQGSPASNFWANAVSDQWTVDVGFQNCQSAVQMGAHNNIGPVWGHLENLYAYNCAAVCFIVENFHHETIGNLVVNNQTQTCSAAVGAYDFVQDLSSTVQQMGNSVFYGDLINQGPTACRLDSGFRFLALNGAIMDNTKVSSRIQAITFGRTVLTQAATMANTSSSIGVTDSTKFRVGMPVFFDAVVNGLTAATNGSDQTTVTYIVKSIVDSTHITIGNRGQYSSAFTATGNTAVNIKAYGMPSVAVQGDGTSHFNDTYFMDIDGEGTSPTVYCENASDDHFGLEATSGSGPVLHFVALNSCSGFTVDCMNISPITDYDGTGGHSEFCGEVGATLGRVPGMGVVYDTVLGVGGLAFDAAVCTAYAIQQRAPSGTPYLYPQCGPMGQHVAGTGSGSLTLPVNGCGDVVNTNGSGVTLTLPLIANTALPGSQQSNTLGLICRIFNDGGATATVSANTGQTFNHISSFTSTTILVHQCKEFHAENTGSALYWVTTRCSTDTNDASPTLSSCGGGTPTITGNSYRFTVTEGTTASGCTVSWPSPSPFATTPVCVASSESGLAFSYTEDTSSFVITNIGALSGTVVDVNCGV